MAFDLGRVRSNRKQRRRGAGVIFGLIVLLASALFAAQLPVQVLPDAPSATVKISVLPASISTPQQAETYLEMDSLSNAVACSATAVGKKTILTAGHCVMPTFDVTLNKHQRAEIKRIFYDGEDHALLILDGVTFEHYLPINEHPAVQGEHVRSWGHGGGVEKPVFTEGKALRSGYYEGDDFRLHIRTLYSTRCIPGDSGAAVVDDRDQIITVVSHTLYGSCGSFPMVFTPEQLEAIE